MSEKTYTLTITEAQARAMMSACELLARVGMCQLDQMVDALPHCMDNYSELREIVEDAERKVKPLIGLGGGGYYGIRNASVPQSAKRAWDLYAVIRHRLSWDRAISEGIIKEGQPRDWQRMMTVNFDEPDNVACERLATIAVAA